MRIANDQKKRSPEEKDTFSTNAVSAERDTIEKRFMAILSHS